jgi:hypothetical protein
MPFIVVEGVAQLMEKRRSRIWEMAVLIPREVVEVAPDEEGVRGFSALSKDCVFTVGPETTSGANFGRIKVCAAVANYIGILGRRL